MSHCDPLLAGSGDTRTNCPEPPQGLDGEALRLTNARLTQEVEHLREATAAALAQVEQLRRVFADSPFPMEVVGPGERLIEANQAFCALLGYTREELLGKTLREIGHPDDLRRAHTVREEMFAGRLAGFTAEVRHMHKDGRPIWTRITTTAVRNARGEFLYCWALSEDVSERRRIDSLLNAQRDLAAALGAATEVEEAWQPCLEAVLRVSGMDACGIYTVGPEGLDLVCHRGISPELATVSAHLPPESIHACVAATRTPFYFREDEGQDCRFPEARAEGHRAMGFLPVLHEAKLVALIVVASRSWAEVPEGIRQSLRDITGQIGDGIARLRVEAALRRSEAQLRRLFANIPDLVLILDQQGTVRFVNRGVGNFSIEEIPGRPFTDYLAPAYREPALQQFRRSIRSVTTESIELQSVTGRWWSCRLVTIDVASGEPELMAIATETTEHRRIIDALRQSEARFRLAFEESPLGIVLALPDTTVLEVNRAYTRMLGYTLEDLSRISWMELVEPEDLVGILSSKVHIEQGENDCLTVEVRARHKEGRTIWTRLTMGAVRGPDGDISYALGMLEDITDRKRAEAALQRKQEFLRQLLEWQERDRKLIVYEIHDGLAQQLASARGQLANYQQVVDKESPQAQAALAQAAGMVDRAAGEARSLISGLRPPHLDEAGVAAALEEMVATITRQGGPRIVLRCDPNLPRMVTSLENNVFRIVQEAVNNARKHSRSKTVRIELRVSGDRLRVRVRDWGVGFDAASVREGRYGLQGIRERAKLFGGRAAVESALGRGTRILVELPMILAGPEGRPA